MPTQPQITIVGLGLIGASLGLALKAGDKAYKIVGHDGRRALVQRAKQMQAIDASHWNLHGACENAGLIVLALPTAAIRPTLEALRDTIRPGSLVIDTAPVKVPILEAAQVILPETVHFVGGSPVLNQVDDIDAQPSADLFRNTLWALCPTPTAAPDAVRVAADLVTFIGAKPLFMDAAEHDGLMAAVDGLPLVLTAALMNTVASSAAWPELRKMAGAQFEASTRQPDYHADDLRETTLSNRANVIHWLDQLTAELTAWRQDLEAGNAEALDKRFQQAIESRQRWLGMRAAGAWEEARTTAGTAQILATHAGRPRGAAPAQVSKGRRA